jgi:hypothetical protein
MKDSERRQGKRFPIRVLVHCLPPGSPRKRNGHTLQGWEMWAQDLGDDGVGLEWSRDWANRNYVPNFRAMDERPDRKTPADPPRPLLKKGCEVILDGLVYNEKGPKTLRGKIQWSRAAKDGRTYEFGVKIISPDRRSYFRALAA